MAVLIRPVRAAEILGAANIDALLEEYDAECALAEMGKSCPQEFLYETMERSGSFQCFGAYDRGMLSGFATVLTYIVPHYGRKLATCESLFVASNTRRFRAGNGLMDAVEDYGRSAAARVILYSAPAGSQFEKLLKLLKRYRHSHTVFLGTL